ncbi:uncharacterized protein LOC143193890 isoform X1 [Rhynchophorus ferrugineus]|uniref:uncharacterized protein LOC143193890 isoform X1 n=1 Tax=Rhynchophorus ferrugineus TaxID=354439 RepID=UPI003FCC3522
MHVNNYFIETLVLCFSCGCDKKNIVTENVGNPSNNMQCSDSPTRFVVGKSINWTTTTDDSCTDYKTPDIDFGPIKKWIQDQLFQQKGDCKPDTKPKEPPDVEKILPVEYFEPPDLKEPVIPTIEIKPAVEYEGFLRPDEIPENEMLPEPIMIARLPVPPPPSKSVDSHLEQIISGSQRECKPSYIRKDSYGRPIPPHLWTRETYSEKQWPLPDYCLAVDYNPTQLLIASVTDEGNEIVNEHSLFVIQRWLLENPKGQFLIILLHEKWSPQLIELIKANFPLHYVIIIDWSMYTYSSYIFTVSYAKLVGESVAKWIHSLDIPADKVTLIGFSLSAHSIGFVGKVLKKLRGKPVYKIIALDPDGLVFAHPKISKAEKLSLTDAQQVLVIHTDSVIGYPDSLGTIDVFVNKPTEGQPWCDELSDRNALDSCSHTSVLDILYYILKHGPVYPINPTKGQLIGFPFNIKMTETGDYHLKIPEHGSSKLIFDVDTSDISISDTFEPEKQISVSMENLSESDWLLNNPSGKIVIIITNREINEKWLKDLYQGLEKIYPLVKIYIIDWSKYAFTSGDLTKAYVPELSDIISKCISTSAAPHTVIIGAGINAYVAALVGKRIYQEHNSLLHQLIALNPSEELYTQGLLASPLAKQVLVIDTYNYNYDEIPSIINIKIDHGRFYCGGELDSFNNDYIEERQVEIDCLDNVAFKYFTQLFQNENPHYTTSDGKVVSGFPFEADSFSNGYYVSSINDFFIEYVLPDAPFRFNVSNILVDDSSGKYSLISGPNSHEINQWLDNNPEGGLYILITNKIHSQNDQTKLFIEELASSSIYLVAINWSDYYYPSSYTNDYIVLVSNALAKWLIESRIPVRRVTIFGRDENAQVASLVGKIIKQNLQQPIHKIVAFNPEGETNYFPKKHYLSPSDASQVLAIHIESELFTLPVASGTVDVFIHFVGKSDCKGYKREHCIDKIVDLIIKSIKEIKLPITNTNDEPLEGFPFNIDVDTRGPYKLYVKVDDKGIYVAVLPSANIYKTLPTNFKPDDIYVTVNGEVISITAQSDSFGSQTFIDNIFVILTDKEYLDLDWIPDLQKELVKLPSSLVITIDLSSYQLYYNSTSTNYLKAIGFAVSQWFKKSHINPEKVTLIGLGHNAHLAGIVGQYVQEYSIIKRIIALNPKGTFWVNVEEEDRLTPADAKQIIVIHTETRRIGFPTQVGNIDVFVNDPTKSQPPCSGPEETVCSHLYSVYILIQSIQHKLNVIQSSDGRILNGFPFDVNIYENGIFKVNTDELVPVILEPLVVSVYEVILKTTRENDISIDDVRKWLERNPNGQVLLIVIDDHDDWSTKLSSIAEDESSNKLIIFYCKFAYAETVEESVEILAKWIYEANIPQDDLSLVGYGKNGNIASLVCKYLQLHFYLLPQSMVAFNPVDDYSDQDIKHSNITNDDAKRVMVVHTGDQAAEVSHGSVTLVINDESGQTCVDKGNLDCSRFMALELFKVYVVQPYSIDYENEKNSEASLPFKRNPQGYYIIDLRDIEFSLTNSKPEDSSTISYISFDGINVYRSPVKEHLQRWSQIHPNGEIVIILDGGEIPNSNWSKEVSDSLAQNYPQIFRLVLDWSEYNDKTVSLTGHAEALISSLSAWIHENRDPSIHVILIGVEKSAHVAGLVGKILQNQYFEPLYKIIAINPDINPEWNNFPKSKRLSNSDSEQVLVIYTTDFNHDLSLGSVSVILNNTESTHCRLPSSEQCDQDFAMNTFTSALQKNFKLELKNTKKEVLVGFPLDIKLDVFGLYSDSPLILEYQDTSILSLVFSEDEISFSRNPVVVQKWLQENPEGQIIFVLDGGETPNDTWKYQVLDLIDRDKKKYPIVIDWSLYNFDCTVSTLKLIDFMTDTISRWAVEHKILERDVIIFGAGRSAHIAALISRDLKFNHHYLLYKIIVVNPIEWPLLPKTDQLSKSDALQVLVIHSIVSEFGYLYKIGTLDVVVTDLSIPWRTCMGYQQDECLYDGGLQAFVNSATESYLVEPLKGYPFDISIETVGVFKIEVNIVGLDLPSKPQDFKEDQLSIVENGHVITINDEKTLNCHDWLERNPYGEIIIIIVDHDNGLYNTTWPQQLVQKFSIVYPPRYVLIIDWSQYSIIANDNTVSYARYVAFLVANWMKTVDINTDIMTLIGFGHSAHVSGLIGKQLQRDLKTPYKIVALNPAGKKWFYLPESEKLHKYDARQVMVIHTETSVYGYPSQLGTVDVFVNNPSQGQLACTGPDWARCSHSMAITILLEALKRTPIVKNAEGKKLYGFPLDVDVSITGFFNLETEINGRVITIDIEDFEPSQIMIQEPNTPGTSIEDNNNQKITEFFDEHPDGELIIFIVDNEATIDHWLEAINILSPDRLRYVLLIDWSQYIQPYSDTILPYSKLVAHQLSKWIILNNVPIFRLTIIAFGNSAHLAGQVGTEIYLGGKEIHKIVALNPAGKLWEVVGEDERLNEKCASQVLVVHTETKTYGYPVHLGTVDVIVNNPKKGQPGCIGLESEKCSHFQSIKVFTEYLKEARYIIRSEYGEVLFGFPLHVDLEAYGVYILNEIIEPKILHDFDIYNIMVINTDNNKHTLDQTDTNSIEKYLSEHPTGEVIILLIDEDHIWLHDLYNVLRKDKIPKYLFIINWAEYKQLTYEKTSLYIKLVADSLAKWIVSSNIPVDRLTIIGFSENAHLAGFTGKYLKYVYSQLLLRIIALNPAGNQWSLEPESERLSSSDAKQVIAIHTETKYFGYANPIGTFDIYINYPSEGQPNCPERRKYECSHYSAIKYLIDTIRRNYPKLKDVNGFTITGFPFKITDNGGIYHILTDISAESNVPRVPTGFSDDEVAVLSGNLTSMSIIDINSDEVTRWLIEHPRGEVVIFITAGEAITDEWLKEFARLVEHPVFPKYILDINWSKYRYPSFSKTMTYGKAVAQMVAKWIILSNIPVQRVTLIAFGTSAHIAGYIGKFVLRENSYPLRKIIALNPAGLQWNFVLEDERLSPTDASQVLVIHTETSLYGYPDDIGTLDVFINSPQEGQPSCTGPERLVCSHIAVIDVFLDAIRNSSFLPISYDGGILHGFPLNVDLVIQGLYNLKTVETEQSSDVIKSEEYQDTPIINVNETVIQLWMEEHRDGEIYIVITAREEEDPDWIDKFNHVLSEWGYSYYILAVDWSSHRHETYRETAPFTKFIASLIAKWLNSVREHADRITLIGFESSAHVAGLVGKDVQENYNFQIKKIVGLNPAGQDWIYAGLTERLGANDAKQVLVLHTETVEYGFPCPLGTLDLYINNPDEGQPWCFDHYKAKCSHYSAVDIFLEGIKGNLIKDVPGFPMKIELSERLLLNVILDLNRDRYLPTKKDFEAGSLKLIESKDMSSPFTQMDIAPLKTWLQENERGEVVIYITESEPDNKYWALDAVHKYEYLHQFSLVVDWSEYRLSPFETTFQNIQLVADSFAKWIQINNIPVDRLILVGFGASAHLAGFIGKYILEDSQKPIYKIIALNPTGMEWNRVAQSQRLNDADAEQVIVIHTELKEIGFPTTVGTIDIFINKPEEGQPWCEGPSMANCSHSSAVDVLLVDVNSPEIQGSKNELRGYPFNVNIRTRGIYNFILKLNKNKPKTEELPMIDAEVSITISGNKNLTEWLIRNGGDIVVIITAREAAHHQEWPEIVGEVLSDSLHRRYVIMIDWSPFKNAFKKEPSPYVQSVSNTVVGYLRNIGAPAHRVVLIGFAESAHLAGVIGKQFKDRQIRKIIALNPTGGNYVSLPKEKRLAPTDASQVLVIHTEIYLIGYPTSLGTIDIYINDAKQGQHWCGKLDRKTCSHIAAIEILRDAIIDPDILKTLPNKLKGFPLDIKSSVKGEYHIFIEIEESYPEHIDHAPDIQIGDSGISVAEIPELSLDQWIKNNPTSDIFILINGDETKNTKWTTIVTKLLFPSYYVLVINWSKYKQDTFLDQVSYIHAVADAISHYITDTKIPLELLTIVGVGDSAHIAGLIAKHYLIPPHKIIALNPSGHKWTLQLNSEKLAPSDADDVIVLHTETNEYGYPSNIGTIDVFLNNTDSLCAVLEENKCLYEYVVNIFIILLEFKTISETSPWLSGYPFKVKPEASGSYIMKSSDINSPKYWPVENYEISEWPAVDFTLANGFDANDVIIKLYKPVGDAVSFDITENQRITYTLTEDRMDFAIIITEQPSNIWAIELKDELLQEPSVNFVIIIDWSMYVYNSYRFTAAYSKTVADAISQWLYRSNVPHNKITIVGFSTSAHVAGLVGKQLNERQYPIHSIVALDPARAMWSKNEEEYRLYRTDANIVQVIHTNTAYFGYQDPLGHYDIYVNGGNNQPLCEKKAFVHKCSHEAAIVYYKSSIKIRAQAIAAFVSNGIAVKQGDWVIDFGYWLVPCENTKQGTYLLEIQDLPPYLTGSLEPNIQDVHSSFEAKWGPVNVNTYINCDIRRLILFAFAKDEGIEKLIRVPLDRQAPPLLWLRRHLKRQVFIIINGDEDENINWAIDLKDTLLQTSPNGLVTIIDWHRYKYQSYQTISELAKPIGNKIAEIITSLEMSVEQLTIIGFSIGAHIAGFAGKRLNEFYNKTLYRITALDPAKKMWEHQSILCQDRLSQNDALIVDVIHTETDFYGFLSPIGSIDVYINNGHLQPNCEDTICSHYRAIDLYMETFYSRVLALKIEVRNQTFIYSTTTEFAIVGYNLESNKTGPFLLLTNKVPPYLKGKLTQKKYVSKWDIHLNERTNPQYQEAITRMPNQTYDFEYNWDKNKYLNHTEDPE